MPHLAKYNMQANSTHGNELLELIALLEDIARNSYFRPINLVLHVHIDAASYANSMNKED
jgi:hypothetical protein